MQIYQKKEFPLEGHKLSLYVDSNRLFTPNAVTVRFSRAIAQNSKVENSYVFDIGTGVCPLGIWAGLEGAREVHAVDSVEEHIKVACMNIKENNLEGIVHAHQGDLFSPLNGKADLIIGDVSGIADKAARALGWYPTNVPTGGDDGTEIVTALLEQAPNFLTDNGSLYFPAAFDLSDSRRIMTTAHKYFKDITPIFKDNLRFFLMLEDFNKIKDVYEEKLPEFMRFKERNSKYYWEGQIYKASQPK